MYLSVIEFEKSVAEYGHIKREDERNVREPDYVVTS